MLVKFKNIGVSTRIMYDVAGVERRFAPGFESEVDLPSRLVRAFEVEADVKKSCTIERLESEAEASADTTQGPVRTFTLLPEEGPQMQEPQTLKEALGRGGAARPPAAEPEIVKVDPELAKSKDPVGLQAERAAKAALAEQTGGETTQTEVKEPATAIELLAAIEGGGVSAEDQIRLANSILDRVMPKGIKPAGIMKLLRAKAATEQ